MTLYFTSDPHFSHRNIIKFCNRPFQNTEEMDEKLIENWNNVVKNNDEIYCLGDFGWQFSPEQLKNVLTRLNGKKHLILGNHDKCKLHIKSQLWDEVEYYKHINYDKKRLILCHYPMYEFDGSYHKSIHLFGHIHDQKSLDEIYDLHRSKGFYSYCVGCDFHNYTPVSFEEIMEKINWCE